MARPPNVNASITIDPYDPRWPDLYAREANRIRRLLGTTALSIDHIGSTAVPGLAARPRIDIDLVVPDSLAECRSIEPGALWHNPRKSYPLSFSVSRRP